LMKICVHVCIAHRMWFYSHPSNGAFPCCTL
jgi:hypothetical protein